MLNVFLSILDRLIKLKEHRDKRVQRIYDDFLEPVFNDLLIVHRDYIQMFEKVRQTLPSIEECSELEGKRKYYSARDYLHEKRIEFEPV